MANQLSNAPHMRDIRRDLRQKQTPAEVVLWDQLRNRRLANTKFRRQHSFGSFVVDFYCADVKLVIEVDGAVHNTPEAKLQDAEREAALCDLGLTIMRFSNDDVLHNLKSVLTKIRENIPL